MKGKISALLSIVMILCFALTPVYAKENEIYDMNIQVHIDKQGNADIEEKWAMNVSRDTEIYKVFENMEESQITNFKVKDEKGIAYKYQKEWDVDASREEKTNQCGIIQEDDRYELCFGIGDYGQRTYTFSYTITNFVKQYNGDQGFNYAFLSDLSLDTKHVRVNISSPYSFHEDNSQIWGFGYDGQAYYEDGKVVMESASQITRNNVMQLLMRIDDGTFEKAYPKNIDFESVYNDTQQQNKEMSPYMIIGILFGIVLLCVGIVGLIGYFVKTKSSKLYFSDGIPLRDKKDIEASDIIPCQNDLFQIYYLALRGNVIEDGRSGLLTAIILRWVQCGYISLDKTKEKGLFKEKDGFSIDLNKEIPLTHPLERKLLGFIKKAAGKNKKLETKEFEKWCEDNYFDLEEWFEDVETEVENEYRQKGLVTEGEVYNHYMGMKFKKVVDIYDQTLRIEIERIIGLQKYLEDISSHHEEIIDVGICEEYLIITSLLGIDDKFQKQIGQICPQYNQQSCLDTFYTTHMIHHFAYRSVTASSNASANISGGTGGSASFTGGGGFSGGGGGGSR